MSSHQHQPPTPVNASWIWSGVHGASGILHPFLAVRDDPDGRYIDIGLGVQFDNINTILHGFRGHPENSILDGSGGLLLIKRSPAGDDTLGDDDESDTPGDDDESDTPGDDEDCDILGDDDESDTPGDDEDCDILGDDDESDTLRDDEDHDTRPTLPALFGILSLVCTETDDQSNNTPEADQHWQTLMVVNPSTHESRVLPPANSRDVGLEFWSYNGVQANLLVDTESQTYKVTLTFPDCVCLYYSTSNAWQCRRFNQRISWGPHHQVFLANPWHMEIANAYVNGRLFFADVVVEDSVPTMNLIEIDAEAGSWKLHNWRYSLQTQWTEFLDTPFLRMRGLTEHGTHQALDTQTLASRFSDRVLELFQIVECMGELYAVIPMSSDECLPMSLRSRRTLMEVLGEYPNFGLSFMPLQFMIVSMRGDGFVHGVLRILVPEDVDIVVGSGMDDDNEDRKHDLMNMLGLFGTEPVDDSKWGFSCTAEGSVIWVVLLDYVLQYDVVSGVSKTEIIGASLPELWRERWGRRAPYRSSDVKP